MHSPTELPFCFKAPLLAILRCGVVALGVWSQTAHGQVTVRGRVLDHTTLQPLQAAHVAIEGTREGTITNHDGAFAIPVDALPITLLFRFLGYETTQVTIGPNDARDVIVQLQSVAYRLPDLVVRSGAFAEGIMAKVIRRKAARRQHLATYRARMYSRISLEHRDAIVLVSEHVMDRFASRRDGVRDVIRSRRSTADFYRALELTPAPQDFSGDLVPIGGLDFVGPTHPDALDHYNFVLAGQRTLGSRLVHDIYVSPKNNQESTLIGRIAVIDSAFAMIEAHLRPATHVVFPPQVRTWNVFYGQQFAETDSFWLPADLQLDGRIHVNPKNALTGSAIVRQIAQLKDYQLNAPIPARVVADPTPLQMDSVSVRRDDLFLMGLDIVALSPAELAALESYRFQRPLTLSEALPAESRGRDAENQVRGFRPHDQPQFVWPMIGIYTPWLRYNRVDGSVVGVGAHVPLSTRTELAARLGKSLGYGQTRLGLALQRTHTDHTRSFAIFERDMQPQQDPQIHSVNANALAARLLQRDYFDWYWANRVQVGVHAARNQLRATLTGTGAIHKSVRSLSRAQWPFARPFPPNTPVSGGLFGSVSLLLSAGNPWYPYHRDRPSHVHLALEYGAADSVGSYARVAVRADRFLRTMKRRRPIPAGLSVRALAGIAVGRVPVERRHAAEGTLGPVAGLGTLRTLRNRRLPGLRHIGIHWEHDFRGLLFESLGLRFLVDRNVGIRLHGAHVVIDGASFHESGLSLVRAPVRVDLTWRRGLRSAFITVGLAGKR